MADMVQVARRRKLAAAQAVGDVHRVTILRGMMTADTPKEVPDAVEAPTEAPAEVEIPGEVPAAEEEIVEPEEIVVEPHSDEVAIETTYSTNWDE